MNMAALELAAALLPDVRNYLDITWADEDGDKKTVGIISRGMAFIQRLTRRPLVFEEGTAERALLFEYCRYARAGAADEFPVNYRIDILTFRTDESVKEYISQESESPEEPPAPVEQLFFFGSLPRQPNTCYVIQPDGIIEADSILMA